MSRQNKFSPEVRERAVRLVQEHRGDSYDNALAESINGLCKAELMHRRAPWKTKAAVELATLEWVAWYNQQRLLPSTGAGPVTAVENVDEVHKWLFPA